MGEPTIRAVIAHAEAVPERRETLAALLRGLEPVPEGCSVEVDTTVGPPSVWTEAQWTRALAGDEDYVLMMNDDVKPCTGFWATLRSVWAQHPDAILCLTNHVTHLRGDGLVSTPDGCVGQAYGGPRHVFADIHRFRQVECLNWSRDVDDLQYLSEDCAVAIYAMSHDLRIYQCRPALVDHATVPSLYGHDGDWARRPKLLPRDPMPRDWPILTETGRTNSSHYHHLATSIRPEFWSRYGCARRYYHYAREQT